MSEVASVGVVVIRLAEVFQTQMAKEKRIEHLVNKGWQLEKWRWV